MRARGKRPPRGRHRKQIILDLDEEENENSLDDSMEESLDLSSEKKEEVEGPNINN